VAVSVSQIIHGATPWWYAVQFTPSRPI